MIWLYLLSAALFWSWVAILLWAAKTAEMYPLVDDGMVRR